MARQDSPLLRLAQAGVAVWLDDLSREMVRGGELAALARRGVVGVTSNPTIFAKAVGSGDAYRDQLVRLAADGASVDEAVWRLTTDDVRDACDVLREVYERTDTVDGRVSIEVDPRLAHDTGATLEAARTLWSEIERPNLFVKIPATVEGLPAITQALAEGISVNVTLIFGIDRYRAVMDAFLTGLGRALAAGVDLRPIGSVASFFVSRVDTAVDPLLDALGTPEAAALRGTAAIANARLAYAAYQEVAHGERWAALAGSGAHPQRPLWASTGVKDTAYPDTRYVDELVAPGVVNTMPRATLEAVADHGGPGADTVSGTHDEAARVVARLAALGVDLDQVTARLEAEGVDKFVASWNELLGTVQAGLDAAAGASA